MPDVKLERSIVVAAMEDFVEKWNRGDLEAACEMYSEDASFITSTGYVHSKDHIMERYRSSFADPAAMGTLILALLEFRPAAGDNPTMATAVLRWILDFEDGSHKAGYCLETYELRDGKIYIVQDATV